MTINANTNTNMTITTTTTPTAKASWIAEKMDPTDPIWTIERQTRPQKVVRLAGGYNHVVVGHGEGKSRTHAHPDIPHPLTPSHPCTTQHDRSSAHVAAWSSVHREAGKEGDHFKLDDSRIWMRLMFWYVFSHPFSHLSSLIATHHHDRRSAREQLLFENENFAYW